MKKRIVILLGLACACSTLLIAQITGGFYNQDGFVYFKGQNISGFGLQNLTIKCVNNYLNEQKTFNISFFNSGGTFTVGPSDGWQWQPGEQLYVTYNNGTSVYWTYQPSTGFNPFYNNNSSNSSSSASNNLVLQERIRQLERKLEDAESSLRKYQEWNRQNPSISGSQLIDSQRRLMRTYQDQIQELRRQMR